MFCLSCQTHIQRKSMEDFFTHTTVCSTCQRIENTAFEESHLPYHHAALRLKYSSILKNKVFDTRVMHDLMDTQGEILFLAKAKVTDAITLSLWMDAPLYLMSYLTLDLIEYIQSLETIAVVLLNS